MEEKYLIFNKNCPIRPLSDIDKEGNSRIVELPKDEAMKCVSEMNKECGENNFTCVKLSDWTEHLQSSEIKDAFDKMDEISKLLKDCDEIKDIIEKIGKMNDKNINGFQIPFVANNNEDFEIKLKEKLEGFIKEIDRPAFRRESNLVDDVKKICQKVIKAFNAAKTGENEEAEKLVSDILKEYKKYPFAVSELDESYAFRGIAPFKDFRSCLEKDSVYEEMLNYDLSFFRARVVGAEEEIHKIDEINYLPYSKRMLAKDMRFSSKGKICFYLGTTSYVCSEECRWNEKDNLYLSSVKFNEKGKKLKVLNLAVNNALLNGFTYIDEKDSLRKELHNAMIRVFPLVIATMFTIKASDEKRKNLYGETIKYEYLLSQILINVLKREGIDGVAYLSRQGKNDFQYPQMVCLAIPVTDINSKNEYGHLINCYNMTKPVLFIDLDDDINFEKKSYINRNYPVCSKCEKGETENYNAKVYYKNQEIFYQHTPFSKIDDYLVNQEYIKFDGENPVTT